MRFFAQAMMIEIMAGKSGSLHGLVHDATSFKFNEDVTAVNHFGQLLEKGTVHACRIDIS